MIKRTVLIHIALKIHILKGTYKYFKFRLRIAVILLKKKKKEEEVFGMISQEEL